MEWSRGCTVGTNLEHLKHICRAHNSVYLSFFTHLCRHHTQLLKKKTLPATVQSSRVSPVANSYIVCGWDLNSHSASTVRQKMYLSDTPLHGNTRVHIMYIHVHIMYSTLAYIHMYKYVIYIYIYI